MSCPICEKRKPARFCPAKGEKICAVCCGTQRELSIDCPPDCPFLLAAHRYEEEHPHSLPADTPLLDTKISEDAVYAHQDVLSGLAFTAAKFCAARGDATDAGVLAALQALAETYRTLDSGIFYEKPPVASFSRELYGSLAQFLDEAKQHPPESSGPAAFRGAAPIKDSEIFPLLVFLYRMGLLRTNGRPRSRRFMEFLRCQFPAAPELERKESRIIVP